MKTWRRRLLLTLTLTGCGALSPTRDNTSGGPGSVVGRDGGTDAAGARAADAAADAVATGGKAADAGPTGGADTGAGGGAGPLDGGGTDGPPLGLSQACATCETTKCVAEAPDFLEIAEDIDWYSACFTVTGKATNGPASGTLKKDLCKAVVDCVHRTQCHPLRGGKASLIDCYCGPGAAGNDALQADCFGGNAQGLCKAEIIAASETSKPDEIAVRAFYNSLYASGAGLGFIQYCETPTAFSNKDTGAPCQRECYGGVGGGTGSGGAGSGGGPGSGGGGTFGGTGGGTGSGSGGRSGSGGGCVDPTATLYAATDNSCQTCQLGSTLVACDPLHLTAQHGLNPDTFDPEPIGWGIETLPTQAERDAATALLRRIGEKNCASNSTNTGPGSFAQIGCLLNTGESPSNVFAGNFADPAVSAVTEYKAAAIASKLKPSPAGAPVTASSSNADFGAAIAAGAVDETNAVGLASNLAQCAIEASCRSCFQVSSGGSGGTSGGSGGAGAGSGGGPGTGSGGAGSGSGGAGAGSGGAPVPPCTPATGGSGGSGGRTASGGSGGGAGAGVAGGVGAGGGTAVGSGGAAGGAAGAAGTPGGCPDLNRDGLADCRQSLVTNPDFNQVTTGWTAEPGAALAWSPTDGNLRPQSGAAAVTNNDTTAAHAVAGTTTVGATQCLPVQVGLSYQVGVQAYLAAGQTGAAGFILDYYFAPDCSGTRWSQPFVSSQVTTTGSWQSIVGTTTQVPIGILAVAVRLVAVKPVAQPSVQVLFDNVLVVVK